MMMEKGKQLESPSGLPLGRWDRLPDLSLSISSCDRRRIVDQAGVMLEAYYAHLPLKRASHAIDPIQELNLLGSQLDKLTDWAFHEEMLRIFLLLRDRHTSYELTRIQALVAALPFRIERCFDHGRMLYIVSSVTGDIEDERFVPGIEVTHWNGVAIARAVELNGERTPGSNLAARRALGAYLLTQRPAYRYLLPDESWIRVSYVSGGQTCETQFEWSGLELALGQARGSSPGSARLGQGVDDTVALLNHTRRTLFAPRSFDQAPSGQFRSDLLPNFKPSIIQTESGTVGYVRITDFMVDDAELFLSDFITILALLPAEGLIIDIRDNPGGYIKAGQLMLQTLTPQQITPGLFHLRNTFANVQMSKGNLILDNWLPSELQSVGTGAQYSQGFPVEGVPDDYNRAGQQYSGPVVLITSAISYSTSDIVTADFRDHGIGQILGVDDNVGAGGANNWPFSVLRLCNPQILLDLELEEDLNSGQVTPLLKSALAQKGVLLSDQAESIVSIPQDWGLEWHLLDSGRTYVFRRVDDFNPALNVYFEGDGAPVQDLPDGVSLSLAIRMSTRTHRNEGLPLEELGVVPDEVHQMTRRDLLAGNLDLIEHAARMLAVMPRFALSGAVSGRTLRVNTAHLDRIDVFLGERPLVSQDVGDGEHEIALPTNLEAPFVELCGYQGGRLAAATRILLVAYFEFVGGQDHFVIQLREIDKIEHARRILRGAETGLVHVQGTVIAEKASYNPDWDYHLEPLSISFFEAAIEVCDASARNVESHLAEVGQAFLPRAHWCPWNSKLTKEIFL